MKTKTLFILLFYIFTVSLSFGQKTNKMIKVSGMVTDINQKPVSGVAILIDNQSTGVYTNNKGLFKIKVMAESKMISVISGYGKVTEVPINGQTKINISVPFDVLAEPNNPNSKNGESNVDVGYGTVKKKNLTKPVNQIDGTNSKYASYRNVYEMLRGQPGVQVNGTSVKIQGASSISGSTEPLFVVDGVIAFRIDDIQPHMVKSIEVLKGSSAAIYGARGANGVIIINLLGSSNRK